jgi:hypothetical protein
VPFDILIEYFQERETAREKGREGRKKENGPIDDGME